MTVDDLWNRLSKLIGEGHGNLVVAYSTEDGDEEVRSCERTFSYDNVGQYIKLDKEKLK